MDAVTLYCMRNAVPSIAIVTFTGCNDLAQLSISEFESFGDKSGAQWGSVNHSTPSLARARLLQRCLQLMLCRGVLVYKETVQACSTL
jgi:hypothetical protein